MTVMQEFNAVIDAVPPTLFLDADRLTIDVQAKCFKDRDNSAQPLEVYGILIKTSRVNPILVLVHKKIDLKYLHQQLRGVVETDGGPGILINAEKYSMQIAVYDFVSGWGHTLDTSLYSVLSTHKSLDIPKSLLSFFK
jgi:hypothetical protein